MKNSFKIAQKHSKNISTYSNVLQFVQTCFNLCKPIPTCSLLVKPAYLYFNLLITAPTYLYLLQPAILSSNMLITNRPYIMLVQNAAPIYSIGGGVGSRKERKRGWQTCFYSYLCHYVCILHLHGHCDFWVSFIFGSFNSSSRIKCRSINPGLILACCKNVRKTW